MSDTSAGTPSRLTRRAFLKTATLTATLSGTLLAACEGTTPTTGQPVSTTTSGPVQAQPPNPVIPGGLGVDIHVDTRFSEADVARIAEGGFRFARFDLPWSQIERERGHYDFSPYTSLLATLASANIRALCILAYNNPLYENSPLSPGMQRGIQSEAARQAFANFAAAAASTLANRNMIWEIWNEPDNPPFWQPSPNPEDYMKLVQETVPAIRRADPQAVITAPALTGLEPKYQQAWDYLERCFSLGLLTLVDALSVHPYRLGPPESVSENYRRLRALLARYLPSNKHSLPLISSEWGYSLTWVSLEQQTAYYARLTLLNLLNNIYLSVWYDWRDDGPDPTKLNDNFGLLTYDGQAKPALQAARTLSAELSGLSFVRQLPLAADSDYALLFSDGMVRKIALWSIVPQHTVSLPISGKAASVTSMLGQRQTLPITNGAISLTIDGNPQYVTLGSG